MSRHFLPTGVAALVAFIGSIAIYLLAGAQEPRVAVAEPARTQLPAAEANALQLMEEGRKVFRYDTFGDEAFWGGMLRLHQAIAGGNGAGPGVSPKLALAVGLKVDQDVIP